MERIELCRGVHLSVLPMDKLKTNYLSVGFAVPMSEKTTALTALVPKVLARGCRRLPDMASINEYLQELYATSVTPLYVRRASALIVGFSADFIKDAYLPEGENLPEKVTDVLFDLLFDPLTEDGKFKESYVESEKTDLVNAIRSKINNKAAYAREQCAAMLFEGSENALPDYGTVEEAQSATVSQVTMRYYDLVARAPMEIMACGEYDVKALADVIRKRLSACPARKAAMPKRIVLSGEGTDVKRKTQPMPVAQGKLVMGLRTGVDLTSEKNAAMFLFNEIFGGSPQSKLFMNVREAKSLCYYCRASYDQFTGAMFVQSGIETKDRERAEEAILAELESTKNGSFTEKDIDDAKRSVINTYKELSDTAGGMSLWYESRAIAGVTDTPEAMIDRIKAVTKEQIVEAGANVRLDSVYFIEGTQSGAEDADEEADA